MKIEHDDTNLEKAIEMLLLINKYINMGLFNSQSPLSQAVSLRNKNSRSTETFIGVKICIVATNSFAQVIVLQKSEYPVKPLYFIFLPIVSN